MVIIHTSDWHLGRTLYTRKRYDEFAKFLEWMAEALKSSCANVLLIAGDIFDTTLPSNRAQELYYTFLKDAAQSGCRHIVIIAGNHDSPSFLNAPRDILKIMNVHVIAQAGQSLDQEVLLLKDAQGHPELIVCAVPYLRDREIRRVEGEESPKDKEMKLVEGIRSHYAAVGDHALALRNQLGLDIPIVGMGHLYTSGGKTVDGDGVRELYIGSLAHVTSAIFPDCFDYVALGHLHVPQSVGQSNVHRYSGSPLPMGFGEARQQKILCQVTFEGCKADVQPIEIPTFQRLESIKGDWEMISRRLNELRDEESSIWLEITYEGNQVMADLKSQIDDCIADSRLDVLRIKNRQLSEEVLAKASEDEALEDLDPLHVFDRLLDSRKTAEEQREELRQTYQEVIATLHETDTHAE